MHPIVQWVLGILGVIILFTLLLCLCCCCCLKWLIARDEKRSRIQQEKEQQQRLKQQEILQNFLELQQRMTFEKRSQQFLEQRCTNPIRSMYARHEEENILPRVTIRKENIVPEVNRVTIRKEKIATTVKEVNYPFKNLGFSTKEGIRMEFRLYQNKEVAMKAATQTSKGKRPVHHKPHKIGDRYHFHPKGHTIETENGPTNIHFMYGNKILDESVFQSEAGAGISVLGNSNH